MKYFKVPSLTPLSMILIGSTLGLLTGCSSQSDDTVTLAQTSDTFTGAPAQQEVDPYASRNGGAWGGVYMTESELNETNRHIVDIDAVLPMVKSYITTLVQAVICMKGKVLMVQDTIHL